MFDKSKLTQQIKTSGALFALIVVFAFLSPQFLSWDNTLNILLASSVIGLLGIGTSLVVGAAGLDLSVGSLVAVSTAVAISLVGAGSGAWGIFLILTLLTGAVFGFINGALIAWVKIPAFITTLGMLGIARGLAFIVTDGSPVYDLPDPIRFIGQGSFLSVPVPVWIFIIVGLLMHILLRYTAFGAHTLAFGDNQKAARSAGICVKRHLIKLYMLSGVLAAIAGLIFAGRVNAVDPSAGAMYELTAITCAILGGTNLFGGRASVIGAMVGALIMGVLQNGLTLLAVPTYYQQVAIGVVLIGAIWLDQRMRG